MRWGKVIANSILAFFTSLSTVTSMNIFLNLDISLSSYLIFAVINATFYGMIAMCKTYLDEEKIEYMKNHTYDSLNTKRKGLSNIISTVLGYSLIYP